MLRGGGDETSAPVLPTPEVVVVTAVPPTPEVVVVTSAPKVIVEIIVATPTPPAVANTTPTLIPTLTPTPTRLPTPTPTLIPTPTPTPTRLPTPTLIPTPTPTRLPTPTPTPPALPSTWRMYEGKVQGGYSYQIDVPRGWRQTSGSVMDPAWRNPESTAGVEMHLYEGFSATTLWQHRNDDILRTARRLLDNRAPVPLDFKESDKLKMEGRATM